MDKRVDRRRLVMTDVEDARGTMWRAVTLTDDGCLLIQGHDLGAGVEQIFESREYEFERRISAAEVLALRRLLDVAGDGDLLTAIERRFKSSHDLETFVVRHGLEGEFWSRIGD